MQPSDPADNRKTPLRPAGVGKRGVRTQFGALCYRHHQGRVEVLLVTSRGRGRWTIPKGWPVKGATPAESARREAKEEAGVRGRVYPVCLGIYSYLKRKSRGRSLPCVVAVFPLRVERLSEKYHEDGKRDRQWFALADAAAAVHAPELGALLAGFDADALEAGERPAPVAVSGH